MTCLDCGSTHQRGRFCNRCGSKRPPNTPAGGTWAVRRLPTKNRTDAGTRTAPAPSRPDAAPRRPAARATPPTTDEGSRQDAEIRGMYDFALARVGSTDQRSLNRYLSVLLADPRSA